MPDIIATCPICNKPTTGGDITVSIGTRYGKDGTVWEREEITWGCGHSTIIDYPLPS